MAGLEGNAAEKKAAWLEKGMGLDVKCEWCGLHTEDCDFLYHLH